jgi:hypothetical protein
MKRIIVLITMAFLMIFSLSGCDMLTPNNPPTIDSDPVTSATVGEAYSYDVEASDVDGDTLTFDLLTYPEDMNIDPTSGLISWDPQDTGEFEAEIVVTDNKGKKAFQSFTITVEEGPDNYAPVIISDPPENVVLGNDYIYEIEANDQDGDTLFYSLLEYPSGMTIDPSSGFINWTPSSEGTFAVSIQVTDGFDISTQSFNITVLGENFLPIIESEPVVIAFVGVEYLYNIDATDADGDTLSYSLISSPENMNINNMAGDITWIPQQTGNYDIRIQVSDGVNNPVEQHFVLSVQELPQRVVLAEVFEGPACSSCPRARGYFNELVDEYGTDQLIVLEEYGWDHGNYTGWGILDVRNRYFSYLNYLGISGVFPDSYFNGLNQIVHASQLSKSNYQNAINTELAKNPKVVIIGDASIGSSVTVEGNLINVSNETLNNIRVVLAVVEDAVPLDIDPRGYVNHVVRDISFYPEAINTFLPGDTVSFNFSSDSLINVQKFSNVHVVIFVQQSLIQPIEVLQALYIP